MKGKWNAFKTITQLQLRDEVIKDMVIKHAQTLENLLIKTDYYANFKNWPADAQLGLIGIAWGIHPTPSHGWLKFPELCKNEKWNEAAEECRISSPLAEGRNAAHKLAFKNAAQAKIDDHDISLLFWPRVLLPSITKVAR